MDEKTLAHLIFEQRPLPPQAFDQRITRQVNRLVREEQAMKKKISVLALCVILILSLTLFGALAELLGLNLFEVFGQSDKRLMELAPKAVLTEVSPVDLTSSELGTVRAGINSAYYDGQSLLVAYSIQNSRFMEAFTPTEEQLARMQKSQNPGIIMVQDPQTDALILEWNKAYQENRPFGFALHEINPSDHTTAQGGIDLPPSQESIISGEDGLIYRIREYESPLPEAARDQEALDIAIGLFQIASYRYFDGQDVYEAFERKESAPMQAKVWRVDAAFRELKGEGALNGQPLSISAQASAVSIHLTLTSKEGDIPILPHPQDQWYGLYLSDESGREYRAEGAGEISGPQLAVSFEGTGQIPNQLFLKLIVRSEEQDILQALADTAPITLE